MDRKIMQSILRVNFQIFHTQGKLLEFTPLMIFTMFAKNGHFQVENQE